MICDDSVPDEVNLVSDEDGGSGSDAPLLLEIVEDADGLIEGADVIHSEDHEESGDGVIHLNQIINLKSRRFVETVFVDV